MYVSDTPLLRCTRRSTFGWVGVRVHLIRTDTFSTWSGWSARHHDSNHTISYEGRSNPCTRASDPPAVLRRPETSVLFRCRFLDRKRFLVSETVQVTSHRTGVGSFLARKRRVENNSRFRGNVTCTIRTPSHSKLRFASRLRGN